MFRRITPYYVYLFFITVVTFGVLHLYSKEAAHPEPVEGFERSYGSTSSPRAGAPNASLGEAAASDDIEFGHEDDSQTYNATTIQDIEIIGNKIVSQGAIRAKIPFKPHDLFHSSKTGQLIRAVYGLKYFRNIQVAVEEVAPGKIKLYIIVHEKDKVSRFIFTGNSHLSEGEIEKKLHLSDIQAIDETDLATISDQLKKLYSEKDYHHVSITSNLEPDTNESVIAHFTINEECKSRITQVCFQGNNCIPSKKLRTIIFTREDWIFGFFDKSGSYQPEAVEIDRHIIENYYHSNGFLTAHVTNVTVDENPKTYNMTVTFHIDEGPIYIISDVKVPSTEVLSEADILARVPIMPGNLYSKERIRTAMENLRLLFGEYGYIYADIQPSVKPDQDNHTVAIEFFIDLGNKISVNRINFVGNLKTRDRVIRRELPFAEGELLTTQKMDLAKFNIERLGFFDQRNGVNWRIMRIDENHADLDLMLKEVKTGQFYTQVGFGGTEDIQSPSTSAKIAGGIRDINFLGTGIAYNLNGLYSRQDRIISGSLSNPWLFEKPINGSIEGYHRRSNYEDFRNVVPSPTEQVSGGVGTLGFTAQRFDFVRFVFDGGYENICYPVRPEPSLLVPPHLRANFQETLDARFIPGNLAWVGLSFGQDQRNHPMFPTRGYQWLFASRFAIPRVFGNFGYFKLDTDVKWYTPLIEEYSLVFHLHAHLGFMSEFCGHVIPYRELYNIGGLATVRGYFFGQIGPSLLVKSCDENFLDSIGAKKAFWINLELQFPITRSMTMRGVLFYDGGAGWDTPNPQCVSPELLRNNRFNYRHSIGFGVRLTYPTPVRIDWGFKLDRNKRLGEPASELHFTALHDF